jgi:hypothetical protein
MNAPKGFGLLAIAGAAIAYFFRDKMIETLPATGSLLNVTATYSRRDVRVALRNQASIAGFNPDWFDAIARHESHWKLDARSPPAATDEKYGGAWGPMQMLKTNIERLGYTVEAITSDPDVAGEAAAKLMAEGNPQTFEDAIAWWNSGHKTQAQVPASSTENDYLASVYSDLAYVQENPA